MKEKLINEITAKLKSRHMSEAELKKALEKLSVKELKEFKERNIL